MNTAQSQKCSCGGVFKYYDGALGYESYVCDLCGLDIADKNESLPSKFPTTLDVIPDCKQRDLDIHTIATDLSNRLNYELGREDISKSVLKSLAVLYVSLTTLIRSTTKEESRP